VAKLTQLEFAQGKKSRFRQRKEAAGSCTNDHGRNRQYRGRFHAPIMAVKPRRKKEKGGTEP